MLTDITAERAVLAGICKYGYDMYADVSDVLSDKTFTVDSNEIIYKCINLLFSKDSVKSIDLPSILSAAAELKLTHIFDRVEERNHLRAIMSFPVNQDNVRPLAAKIRRLEITRLLIEQLGGLQNELQNEVTGDEPIYSILGKAENRIIDFSSLLVDNMQEPVELGRDGSAYIKHLVDNPREIIGLSSGYHQLDVAIGGGFRNKTVNMIGARMKIGKSMLASNIGYFVSAQLSVPVLYLDTEMSKEDQLIRLTANVSGVQIREIESGKLQTINREKVFRAASSIEKLPFDYKNVSGMPFEEIVAIMRRWIIKRVGKDAGGNTKPCLIIYDYLKLMSQEGLNKNLAEYQLLGFQMTGLHNFAVKYDIPILSFVQLNRDGIDREDTSIVSGSDRILFLCSNFSVFKKKTEDEMAETGGPGEGNRKLIPMICRHGPGLDEGDYINMKFNAGIAKITEGKTRNTLLQEKISKSEEF